MDWLKCNICFNTYNESSLRPRSLPCGHTYCESCLKSVIQNETLTCPQCREMHEISSVFDIPINFNLEGLLTSLNISSQDVTDQTILSNSQEKSDTEYKRESNVSLRLLSDTQEKGISQKELLSISAGLCNDHPSKECLFRCSVHMCWVCEKCIKGNGDHPNSKCKILPFKKEIEFRKQEHKQSLEGERKACNQLFSEIESHIYCLRDKREIHITLVNHLQEVLDMHRKDEENLQSEIISLQRIIEEGKTVHQELLDAEGTIYNAATLDESNAARDLIKIKTADTRKLIDTSHRKAYEGKENIDNQAYTIYYRKKYEVINKEIEKISNTSGINEQSANKIKSRDTEPSRLVVSLSSALDQPASFWTHPGSFRAQVGGFQTQPDGGLDQSGGGQDRPGSGLNQPSIDKDRSVGYRDRPSNERDRPGGHRVLPNGDWIQPSGGRDRDLRDWVLLFGDRVQPSGCRDWPSGGRRQPGGGFNRPVGGWDQSGDSRDWPGCDRDRPGGDRVRPSGDRDQDRPNRDRPGGDRVQPSGGRDRPGGGWRRPSGGWSRISDG